MMLPAGTHSVLLMLISDMRIPRNMSIYGHMFKKLNMGSLLHWCVSPLVVWVKRLLCFTRVLLIYLPLTGDCHTAQQSIGYNIIMVCPFPCAFVEQVFFAQSSQVAIGLACGPVESWLTSFLYDKYSCLVT